MINKMMKTLMAWQRSRWLSETRRPHFDMPSCPQSGDRYEAEFPQTETARIISRVQYKRWNEEAETDEIPF
jgi:hypothetical protein